MKANYELVELLKRKNLKLSTAESITGGKLISSIIEVSGASKITEQSYIVYSNKAKVDVLGVDEKIINKFGVVSKEVAIEMARKLKTLTGSDIVISTTGEAGPTLNEQNIMVGTVCIGLIIIDEEYVFEKVFTGDRLGVMNSAISFVVKDLLNRLS